MTLLPTANTRPTPKTWQGLLRLTLGSALFWALAASVLFLAAPGVDSWGRLLVFSECNGMGIVGIAMLLRSSRWFPNIESALGWALGWALTGVIAIPAGYVAGHALAFLILGEPFRVVSPGQDRLVPIVFTVLIAGFGLHYFATRERLANEAAARSEAQRLATEFELRLLRAQLEPHMLFNTLANLRSLVSEDSQQAEFMIDQLITYLRSALAASRTELSSLRDEFAQLRAYLDIMSVRMGPRLSFRLDLPSDLELIALPPMLLQPLVENAIKHGLEPKVGAGRIEVRARRADLGIEAGGGAGVEISVRDTGLGLSAEGAARTLAQGPSASYGLQHVRERLRAAYGPRASLTLAPQTPTGLCASVRIPQ
jgi:signal transduction histidine kinase